MFNEDVDLRLTVKKEKLNNQIRDKTLFFCERNFFLLG